MMARIKIEITGEFLYTAVLPVRITDINYGNHTGNDSIVGFLQEVRMQWLHQYGFTELDIEGTGLIMSGLEVEFKNESQYGNILEIELFADNITRKSFVLYYSISKRDLNNVAVIAKARTEMVSFDYDTKKVVSMPESLWKILKGEV